MAVESNYVIAIATLSDIEKLLSEFAHLQN